MKPTSSLSKSMKKSKSRSKLSKSAATSIQASVQQATTTTTIAQEAATPTTVQDLPKEKANHRSYAGFGPKSIKIIWEQHDTTDTDVIPDVYTRLAEDATYKVWELVNNIKTYARHSGGKVTSDLVNEVLKDSDCPPILGAADTEWDKIEYDGNFFFHTDHILELRDEYLKETNSSKIYNTEIISTWSADRKESKTFLEFVACLCNAVFIGNDESYNYGLNIAASAPQVSCTLKLILRKCVEMLAFEQKFPIIERCLNLLKKISINPYTRDVECRDQLFHLSELMICQLVGTIDAIKQSSPPPTSQIPIEIKTERKEESFELVKNFLENSDEQVIKKESNFNNMDVDDIRNQYEALFQMMERDGFQERDDNSETPNVDDIKVTQVIEPQPSSSAAGNEQQQQPPQQPTSSITIKIEKIDTPTSMCEENNCEEQQQPQSKQQQEQSNNTFFSPYQTEICDFQNIDLIASTIGCLASQFGYFQNECTFLIQRRMQIFFDCREAVCDADFEFISRCIKGLISLGEYAFREIIPFLDKIDPLYAPEFICYDFAPAAVFLRGRDDIFLYEWLEALCGYKLVPFCLYAYNYYQKLMTKLHKNLRKPTYTIKPKISMKSTEKRSSTNKLNSIDTYFPERNDIIKTTSKEMKKIDFRFAGCRQIPIKLKSIKNDESILLTNRSIINNKVIISKRKLLKPLSDKRKVVRLSNLCYLNI